MERALSGFPDRYILEGSHAGMCSELGGRGNTLARGTFPVTSLDVSLEQHEV